MPPCAADSRGAVFEALPLRKRALKFAAFSSLTLFPWSGYFFACAFPRLSSFPPSCLPAFGFPSAALSIGTPPARANSAPFPRHIRPISTPFPPHFHHFISTSTRHAADGFAFFRRSPPHRPFPASLQHPLKAHGQHVADDTARLKALWTLTNHPGRRIFSKALPPH